MLSILFLLFHLGVVFTCIWGVDWYCPGEPSYSPSYYYQTEESTTTQRGFNHDDLERNMPEAWGGITPPAELVAVWREWLDDYKEARKLEAAETDEKYKHARGPGSGWPPSWQGLNGGFSGEVAPPWAYHPINTGLPDFCYLPPKKGSCDQHLTRWAFNPYIAECFEFTYSGCDENQNNFMERLKCEESCMKTPVSGCDPETQQYIMVDD